jgi:hypothetical protein
MSGEASSGGNDVENYGSVLLDVISTHVITLSCRMESNLTPSKTKFWSTGPTKFIVYVDKVDLSFKISSSHHDELILYLYKIYT